MDLGWLLSCFAAGWWCVAIFLLLLTSIGTMLQPWLQARRARNREQPPVSALLPVKLCNPGFEEAQRSIFIQRYPDYEVLFSAAEAHSPALEVVEGLKDAHPEVTARIMQSHCDTAVSPKLNTLAAPLAVAAHDFVLTKDSNIIFEPQMMAAYMENFTAGVGLVVGVPIAERPETLAGHIEAFLINGHARLLLTASALGFGFGVGKAMLFRRGDLARAGGFEAMAYTLAEDTAISKGFAAMGLKTVFAHKTLRQIIGRRSLRDIYDRQLRWSVIRRAHEIATFPLEPLASPLPAAFAAALAAPLVALAPPAGFGLTLLGWFACEIVIAWLKGWEVSIFSPLAFLGREILALAAWLRAWTTNDVVWANGSFGVFNAAQSALAQDATLPLRSESAGAEKL